MQKDNSTYEEKVAIRRVALGYADRPVILETHGGTGQIYKRVYSGFERGLVFEKNEAKAGVLAAQRPTWLVYEADCVDGLRAGIGRRLPINYVDIDPYGDPWPVLDAFLASDRERGDRLVVVVNDGLRQGVQIGISWRMGALESAVREFGSDLHDNYLAVCRWLIEQKAAQAGYRLSRFYGYHCGHGKQMTHYLAILDRDGVSA